MQTKIFVIVIVILVLFLLQLGGTWLQVRDYREAVRRIHRLGNVGVGQTRCFLHSNLVLIACDSDGIIRGVEVLDGIFVFSHFHPIDTIAGRPAIGHSIYEFLDYFQPFDAKQRKRNKGWIQALEALQMRLSPA